MNISRVMERIRSIVLADTVSVFCTVLVLGLVSFLLCVLVFSIVSPADVGALFGRMSDVLFSDYYCSIVYSLDQPYSKYQVIYPALINLVYEFLGHVSVANMTDFTGDLEVDLYLSQIPMTICIGFHLIGLALLVLVARRMLGDRFSENRRNILFCMLLFTTPVFAVISAGNCLMYSVVCVGLFLMGYDSDVRVIRYASFVALALATCMKMTPALFALLLLRNRSYSDFLICAGVTAVLFLVPFLFTDGTPLDVVKNIFALPADKGGSISNIAKLGLVASDATGIPQMQTVFSALSYLMTALVVVLVVLDRRSSAWVIIMMLCCILVVGPGVGTRYLSLNMVPALILFLRSETKLDKTNLVLAVLLGVAFMMLPSDLAIIPTFAIIALLCTTIVTSVRSVMNSSVTAVAD